MAVTARWYHSGISQFYAGSVDWDADTIKVALVTSSYTFSDAHNFFDDITNEVTGTGYTAGGMALGTKTNTITDSSALTAWAATTAYTEGQVRRATTDNGHVFRCTVAGTSGGSEPTWVTGTLRETADGATVKWVEFGSGIVVLDAADTVWSASTITARAAVIYEDTGTPATSSLLGFCDFGANFSSSNGDFTIQWAAEGILRAGLGSPTSS